MTNNTVPTNSMTARLLALPRRVKQAIALIADVIVALAAVWLAFYLRIDQTGGPVQQQGWAYAAALLFVPVFVRLGLYRAIFRYAGMSAVLTVALATAIYGAVYFILLVWTQWQGVPRSVGLIEPMVFLLLAGGWRLAARWLLQAGGHHGGERLLIYGAGEAGVQTARALALVPQFVLCGFADDDPAKVGRTIDGVPIVGPGALRDFVERHAVTEVLLAIPSLEHARRREVIDRLHELSVHVRTLPGLLDLASGKVAITDFQELDIEDLLGREPVQPDRALLARNLRGKVVLVTGAGGSIGSELCRQIVLEHPAELVLLDHSEYALYAIDQELRGLCRERGVALTLVPRLGSIRNLRRLRSVFAQYRPQTVYHAAAYKHVPMVQENPSEGVLNNVFGTLNAARAAIEAGVERFVLISTDKAVRPTNVMGATKRMAELVLQALAQDDIVNFSALDRVPTSEPLARHTTLCMVRFGNVLGSSGSVVPLFRRQIQRGGPITLTHADVTRYFMTIPEAAQLVLQAGAMGQGGEVFLLDMGKPVKIIDLARRMVRLSGKTVRDAEHPGGEVPIEVVGLRPGEKLYEELLIGDNPEPTAHPRIMKAREQHLAWAELLVRLQRLRDAARAADTGAIDDVLCETVSGYRRRDEQAEAVARAHGAAISGNPQ